MESPLWTIDVAGAIIHDIVSKVETRMGVIS
jgi:hypothetical protein